MVAGLVDEWKTNLMSLVILFHLSCAQHVSDINISIFRSLQLVDELPHRSSYSQFVVCWSFGAAGVWWCSFCRLHSSTKAIDVVHDNSHFTCYSPFKNQSALLTYTTLVMQNEHHQKPAAPKLQHTTNWEQADRCGNSTTQSQAPEDGYINVRNMLST